MGPCDTMCTKDPKNSLEVFISVFSVKLHDFKRMSGRFPEKKRNTGRLGINIEVCIEPRANECPKQGLVTPQHHAIICHHMPSLLR